MSLASVEVPLVPGANGGLAIHTERHEQLLAVCAVAQDRFAGGVERELERLADLPAGAAFLDEIIGGGQESSLRAGTENIALIAGMGLAAEIATADLSGRAQNLTDLESQFKTGLKEFFPNAVFNGNNVHKLPGLINVSFPGFRSDILVAKLDRAGMAVSSGSACGSGIVEPSDILKAMGVEDEQNISTLRISFGSTTTADETADLLSAIKSIITS